MGPGNAITRRARGDFPCRLPSGSHGTFAWTEALGRWGAASRRRCVMPVSVKTRHGRRLVVARRRFPARTLHLVDIENLAGAAIPSLVQVMDVQDRYARTLSVGVDDQVVMASSHLGFMNAALGWPHA